MRRRRVLVVMVTWACALVSPWGRSSARADESEHDNDAHLEDTDMRAADHATATATAPARDPSKTGARPIGRAREPSIEQVVRAAIEAHADELAELDALSERARLQGLVPTLELSARRGQTVDLSQSQNVTTDSLRVSADDALTLQAGLRFDLPRLLFAREEIALARERRRRMEAQQARVEEVTALYFERRRLLLRIAQHPDDQVLKLRIEEIEARLSAFTGGRFRQMIENEDAKPTATPALRGRRRGRDLDQGRGL